MAKNALGADQVTAIEASIAAQISAKANPTTGTGVPVVMGGTDTITKFCSTHSFSRSLYSSRSYRLVHVSNVE